MKKQKKKYKKIRKRELLLQKKWKEQRAERGWSDCDTYDIRAWFLKVMPEMLQQFRNDLHSYPTTLYSAPDMSHALDLDKDDNNKEKPKNLIEWENSIDRMILLLKEMDEDTCSVKNRFEKEYFKINEKFRKKYGFCGDKLKSKKRRKKEKKKGRITMLTPSDFPKLYPDYNELKDRYFREELLIQQYRDRCREEFFNLFSKYFWDLWD